MNSGASFNETDLSREYFQLSVSQQRWLVSSSVRKNIESPPAILKQARASLRMVAPYRLQNLQSQEGRLRLHWNEPPELDDDGCSRYPAGAVSSIRHQLATIWNTAEERVLPTRGAEEAIDYVIRAFCETDDDVLIPVPSFHAYTRSAKLNGARPIESAFYSSSGTAPTWRDRFRDLRHQFTDRTKIVFFCNPNNPTGEIIDQSALVEFVEFVKDRALIVIDEAYIEFSPLDSVQNLSLRFSNVVTIRSLSKAWGAAGLRVGGIIGHPDVIRMVSSLSPAMPFSRPQSDGVTAIAQQVGKMHDRVRTVELARAQVLNRLDRLKEKGVLELYRAGPTNFLLMKPAAMSEVVQKFEEHQIDVRIFDSEIRIAIPNAQDLERLLHCLDAL